MTPIKKSIGTAFTDWWNWSDGSPSYQDAFKAGYEAALRAQPVGWIDASKQMPPPQVRVLGFEPQYNIVDVDTWFGPDFQWGYSYWMPLPTADALEGI